MNTFLEQASKLEETDTAEKNVIEAAVITEETETIEVTTINEQVATVDQANENKKTEEQVLLYVPLTEISTEKQVRKKFDDDYISDLANDFLQSKDKQPTTPVCLWLKGDKYVLSTGENRLRAVTLNNENDNHNPDVIKAIVIGKYPRLKSDRLQGQIKENLLRKSLNLGELALALQSYFKEHPKANNVDAAKWCGYVNSSSGRKKIAKAKLLMEADPAILQKVVEGEMTEGKAIAEIKNKDKEPEPTNTYQKTEVNNCFTNIADIVKTKDDWTLNEIIELLKKEFNKNEQ